jgi:hypothetical protein
MRHSLVLLLLVACGGGAGGVPGEAVPQIQLGDYEYRVLLPNGSRMEGVMTVTRDTILLEPAAEHCRAAPPPYRPTQLTFLCVQNVANDEIRLLVDRISPATRMIAEIQTRVERTTRVCVEYTTDSAGRRICVRSENQTSYVLETRQERVVVTPIRPAPPPGQT